MPKFHSVKCQSAEHHLVSAGESEHYRSKRCLHICQVNVPQNTATTLKHNSNIHFFYFGWILKEWTWLLSVSENGCKLLLSRQTLKPMALYIIKTV